MGAIFVDELKVYRKQDPVGIRVGKGYLVNVNDVGRLYTRKRITILVECTYLALKHASD